MPEKPAGKIKVSLFKGIITGLPNIDYPRSDVGRWLNRPPESYYPLVFADAIHVKILRKRSVTTEAFHGVLGVKEDKIPLALHKDKQVTGYAVNPCASIGIKNTDQGLVEKEKMNNFVSRLIKKLDWRHTQCNTTCMRYFLLLIQSIIP
ncbi:hypothetical protein D7D25_03600 [Proteiniphilum sp. X52]|nr:hypothetical protein D7D25_03600 [Proteiniphilum sp. X52]